MLVKTILCLFLVGGSATPAEELFDIPGFDAGAEKDKFEKCIHEATSNFTDTHQDEPDCPESCLMCVHDPKTCPFKCVFRSVCGCGQEIPTLAMVYVNCCDLLEIGPVSGKEQCVSGLHQMENKAMRTIEYQCGVATTTGLPGSCSSATVGSCAWFGCHASRNAVCNKETYRCDCRPGDCAHDGVCSPQGSQNLAEENGDAVAAFTQLVEDVKSAASFEVVAPELAQRCAEMDRLKAAAKERRVGQLPTLGVACGVGAFVAMTAAGLFRHRFRSREEPKLLDALG